MYEFDSLSAEFSTRDTLFDLGRRVLGKTFEKNDNFESSVEVEGEKYMARGMLKAKSTIKSHPQLVMR